MNWKIFRDTYLPQIERKLQQIEQIRQLHTILDLSPVIADGKMDLNVLEDQLERFGNKLRQGQFVITVVGKEESGKSTLVNALIGALLLPEGANYRTTLAAVEIRKAISGHPNSAEIIFKTKEEFREIKSHLSSERSTKPDDNRIKEEFDVIGRYQSVIDAHVGQPPKTYSNQDLKALSRDVHDYIVNEGKSRAVKKITIHIQNFAFKSDEKEIILQDLPGYNSPAKSHREQTDHQLRNADLIIFVFPVHGRVDLDKTQVEILEVSDATSKAITTKEKIFIFLNKVDSINPLTRDNIENKKRKAVQDWERYVHGISVNRFTAGSAEARHVELKLKEDQLGAAANLNRAGLSNGIEELIDKVNLYLENERPNLLKDALDKLISESTDFIGRVKSYLTNQHGVGSDSTIGSIKESYYYGQVNDWWMEDREKLIIKFRTWYYKEVLQKDNVDDLNYEVHPSLSAIKNKHIETVNNISSSFIIPEQEVDIQIQASTSAGVAKLTEANYNLRKKHVEKCLAMVEETSAVLSEGLKEVVQALFDEVYKNLGLKDPTAIKEYLEQKYHNNDSNKISYEAAIRALIVRYARPTIRIFMEVPHGLNDRSNKIQAHWKDIEILKLFSEKINSSIFDSLNLIKPTKIIANVASATSNLDDFINAVEATAEVVDSSINLIAKSKSPIQTGSESRNKEELIEELNQDIESISHLLKNPIFEAAGVLQYCLQEVERVKEFIEKEIQGSELVKIIYQEFDKNNIPILQALNQEYETKHRSSTEIAQLYTSIWE